MADSKHIVKISIDKSRSHTAGIMPYIPYGDEPDVKYVSTDDESGNWGGFPLDLAIMNETFETGVGDLNVRKHRFKDENGGCKFSTSRNRLRYAELARRYYEIQNMLDKGIFTKAISKCKSDETEKVSCMQNENPCEYEKSEPSIVCETVLTKYFDRVETAKYELFGTGIPMPDAYAFKPVPIEDFYDEGRGIYKPKYVPISVEDVVPFSYLGTDADDPGTVIEEGKYYVIINDYEKYVEYEKAWKSWWEENDLSYDNEFPAGEGDFAFCKAFEKYFIGKVEVPDTILGAKVPPYVYYVDVEGYKDWFEKNGMTTKEAVAKKPEELREAFDNMGGLEFYNFLTKLSKSIPWITELPTVSGAYGVSFVTPYISLPITLEDNHEYGGIYESYMYSYSEKDGEFKEAFSEFDGYGSDIMRWYEPTEAIFVDSQLSAVIDKEATEVDNITGVWGTFGGGMSNIFKCVFREGPNSLSGDRGVENVRISEKAYGHWDCKRLSLAAADRIKCGDGERVSNGDEKYRTITILECIRDIVKDPILGSEYYFLVKRDNCESVPFRVPYSENSYHNMSETSDPTIYTGDYVTSIETTDNTWKIQYVIGGQAKSTDGGITFTPIDKTGVKYEEEYEYRPKQAMITSIDGHDGIRVVYDWIGIEESKQEVYSEQYRIYRKTNLAKIVGMEVGSIMAGKNKSLIKAMIFTRDGSDSLPSETKDTLNVVLDRGMAAAFERHFKLSECNTFEDLKNYGNNFYKL